MALFIVFESCDPDMQLNVQMTVKLSLCSFCMSRFSLSGESRCSDDLCGGVMGAAWNSSWLRCCPLLQV